MVVEFIWSSYPEGEEGGERGIRGRVYTGRERDQKARVHPVCWGRRSLRVCRRWPRVREWREEEEEFICRRRRRRTRGPAGCQVCTRLCMRVSNVCVYVCVCVCACVRVCVRGLNVCVCVCVRARVEC